MFPETEQFEFNGHFFYTNGDDLRQKTADVPDLPGVFYIVELAKQRIEVVYIGAAGALRQDGSIGPRLLREAINTRPGGTSRQAFFEQQMAKRPFDALDIYWFVTFDDEFMALPTTVAGNVVQSFFEIHGCLPRWNEPF